MRKFTIHRGVAVPLLHANIDTDSIIPSRDIRRVSREGLGDSLFSNWRYQYDGDQRIGPDPEFVLNNPAYSGATILLAGENFGCGSSREQAVWAILDYGIRAIIAPGFGAIFYNNCLENGLLPVRLKSTIVNELARQVAEDPGLRKIEIRLTDCSVISPDGQCHTFEIGPLRKQMLLDGLDSIEMTLKHAPEIEAYTRQDRSKRPWAYLRRETFCNAHPRPHDESAGRR